MSTRRDYTPAPAAVRRRGLHRAAAAIALLVLAVSVALPFAAFLSAPTAPLKAHHE